MPDVKYSQSPVCLYSIRDDLAQQWGPVFEAVNDAVALREYARIMAKVDQKSDYRLIRLASFCRDSDIDNGDFLNPVVFSLPLDISDALASDEYFIDDVGLYRPVAKQEVI